MDVAYVRFSSWLPRESIIKAFSGAIRNAQVTLLSTALVHPKVLKCYVAPKIYQRARVRNSDVFINEDQRSWSPKRYHFAVGNTHQPAPPAQTLILCTRLSHWHVPAIICFFAILLMQ